MSSTAVASLGSISYIDSVFFGKKDIETDKVQIVDLLHDVGVIPEDNALPFLLLINWLLGTTQII